MRFLSVNHFEASWALEFRSVEHIESNSITIHKSISFTALASDAIWHTQELLMAQGISPMKFDFSEYGYKFLNRVAGAVLEPYIMAPMASP